MYMKMLNKTKSPMSFFCVCVCVCVCVLFFLFPKTPFRFLFYFTAAGVKCCVVSLKRLTVLHQNANYIFIFLGSLRPVGLL